MAKGDDQEKSRREVTPGEMFLQVLSIPALMACVVVLVAISAAVIGVAGTGLSDRTHTPAAIYGFAAVCTFLSLWLVLGSVFSYLNVGQAKKIENIAGFYSVATIADYFDQFWSGRDGIQVLVRNYRSATGPAKDARGKDLEQKFKELFASDFGLRAYIIPVILFTAAGGIVLFFGYAGGIGLALAKSSAPEASQVDPLGMTVDLISLAAIFGAYTWVASDVIVRNHQWTLHPSDLAWYALRLIVAVPLGQALALTVGGANAPTAAVMPGAGAFVAFVVSMFSLDAITTALGTAATRFGVQMNSSAEERDDLIIKLAGVDDAKARALNVEGVSTIAQLVAVDPIRTSIRTGLPFEYILNLIDAALLWTFVGDKLKPLRPLGLTGASDVLTLGDAWRADDTVATALTALRQCDAALALARQSGVPAAVTAAEAARARALDNFFAASGLPPGPAADRTAMLTALATSVADGGPGMTAIGFETIVQRLRRNSYAMFVRRLLGS